MCVEAITSRCVYVVGMGDATYKGGCWARRYEYSIFKGVYLDWDVQNDEGVWVSVCVCVGSGVVTVVWCCAWCGV